jgi:hypothetical protein
MRDDYMVASRGLIYSRVQTKYLYVRVKELLVFQVVNSRVEAFL